MKEHDGVDEKNNAHTSSSGQCSVTVDKNHPPATPGLIIEPTADEGGTGVTKWIDDVCSASDIVIKMTPLVSFVAFLLIGSAAAVVRLECSDNATCIEHATRDMIRSLRQQKAVRIFDLMTIEPLGTRQARSSRGLLTRFLESHAFSFDWNDFTFRISQPRDGSDKLEVEVFESRTAKDVSEPSSKKSSSKAEEEKEEDKTPKLGIRRRHKKKVLQVIVPLLFGMKSAGAVIFAFTLVAVLTIKAFVASKMALLVTVGMAMKKLYDSYSSGN
ncbi:hypothetical protein O3G_MSEX012139 [Manduca sexta]|uniref:Uncharacterized protein n=1 Tax=Manduca sexta TaxID=7130 RepID=A0A921ZN39_MANSE|nr:hypothetical protein O3G_MSEX012139 [Manduca sexta]